MSEAKTVSVSFRVSAHFKQLLMAAAAHEHRSQTNLLEYLLYAYCNAHGISVAPPSSASSACPKKAATN